MKMKETSITKNKTILKRPQLKHCDTIFYHGIIQGFGILKPNTQPCHGSPPPWGSFFGLAQRNNLSVAKA